MAQDDQARTSSRRRLSKEIVLAGAVTLIERDGARALSMRSLGRELGVEAMSLYRYVPNFDALLDEVVAQAVHAMLDDPQLAPRDDDDWRAFLTRQAHGVRSIAVHQPEVFPLVATRTPSAPWIRPPLRSLRWVEEFLSGLLARGFADAGAVATYRSFTSFLLGHLLLEVSGRGVDTGPVEQPELEVPDEDTEDELAAYPAVARLTELLAEDHAEEEFQAALTALLDRLEHLNGLPSTRGLGGPSSGPDPATP